MCHKVRVNKFNPDKLGGRVSPIFGWGLVVSMFCPLALSFGECWPTFWGAVRSQAKFKTEAVSYQCLNFGWVLQCPWRKVGAAHGCVWSLASGF